MNPEAGKASWFQANSVCKIYTQAVRSGYPAEKVIGPLKLLLAGRQPYDDRGDHVRMRDNLTLVPPVHSLEYVGLVEAIDSMLLQSHDGTIRVFPVWLKGKDASFRNLRAYGAFLVSSEFTDGSVASIDIASEVGGTCTVENPWIDKKVEVVSFSPEGSRERRVSSHRERDRFRYEKRSRIQNPSALTSYGLGPTRNRKP